MNKHCEKTTAHSQNILHGDTVYNINRNKYNTFCAALAFVKVTFNRIVMIVYRIWIFFLYLLCSWIIAIFKECMIKSRSSHCLYIDKFYFNASKLCQKWKKLQNVTHIYNVSRFRCTFSTFPNKITLYICWECQAYAIKIMLYYLVLQSFT